MRTDYTKIKNLSDELCVLSHPQYGEQVWSIVKVRKHKLCIYTHADLYGQFAWSPITNGNNRMDRISTEAMNKIPLI